MINVLVTSQYYENYNTTGEGAPYWKPKGSTRFMFPVEDGVLFYGDDTLVEAISRMLTEQSSEYARYEYRDYDVLWELPRVVTGLGETIENVYKELELISKN